MMRISPTMSAGKNRSPFVLFYSWKEEPIRMQCEFATSRQPDIRQTKCNAGRLRQNSMPQEPEVQ
jgi:hypothetical protein